MDNELAYQGTCGLSLFVMNEEDMEAPELDYKPETWKVDREGQMTLYEMEPMPGEALVKCQLRQGMSAQYAARLLRKLAQLIDRNGQTLLNLENGILGDIDKDGHPVEDPICHIAK